jgi:hypothetical protein
VESPDELNPADNEGLALDYGWGGDGSDLHEPVRAHVEAALVPTDAPYPPPVDELTRLGELGPGDGISERIAALGLTQAHVPDLIRMARDRALNTAWSDSDEVWAPIYALHALDHLDVSAFVPDLIPLFDVDADWVSEDLPEVLGNAGAPALEPLRQYLRDRTRWNRGRTSAGLALERVADRHPELREPAIQIITDELAHAEENDPVVNGFLLANLLHLNAVEALPVIRRVFEQDAVDETIAGDWSEVLTALGETPDPADPLVTLSRQRWDARRATMWPAGFAENIQALAALSPVSNADDGSYSLAQETVRAFDAFAPASPSKAQQAKQKNKRKMAAASRKTNRKKKRK